MAPVHAAGLERERGPQDEHASAHHRVESDGAGGVTVGPPARTQAAEPSGWQRTAGALRYRDYRYLWAGQVCSGLASWMDEVIRGWIAYQITGSPLVLGIVTASRHVPLLVFGAWAGVLADRVDRRVQLVCAQWGNMAVDLVLVVLLVTDLIQPWHLAALALTAGSLQSFMQPARQAMLPEIVPRSDLMGAIAFLSIAFNTSKTVGPAVAGVLIGLVGPVGAAWGEVLLHFLGGASILFMRHAPPPQRSQLRSPVGDLLDGLRYVLVTPHLAILVTITLVPMLVGFPYNALLPVYAQDILQVGPEGLGLLYSAAGVGAVAGLLALGYLGDLPHKGGKALALLAGFGVGLLIFARSPNLPLSLAMLFFIGLTSNVFHAFVNQLLQVNTEDRYRGRVMSLYAMDRGILPVGLLSIGLLAELFGPSTALTIMPALMILMAAAVAWRRPSLRSLG